MTSPTQRALTTTLVADAAKRAFGLGTASARQLDGGSYGSVWMLELDDGRTVVLKAAPEPGTPLLTYEAGILAAEAEYLRLTANLDGVPTADLLYVDDEFVFMSALPGSALYTVPEGPERDGVREQCGAAIAHLHGVTSGFFGYSGDRPHASTWPEAYSAMIEALLADAVRWGVTLPVAADDIRACIVAGRDLLATVTTPVLLHFDLWDGNVLATVDDSGRANLAGLVDGERYLYGDPMIDFCSPALFTDMLDTPVEHPFLRGYRSVRSLEVDTDIRRRLWYAMLYLYLLMIVEYPSRGMSPDGDPGRWQLLSGLVTDLVGRLRAAE